MDCRSVHMAFSVETNGGQMYKYTKCIVTKLFGSYQEFFNFYKRNNEPDSSVNTSSCTVYIAILKEKKKKKPYEINECRWVSEPVHILGTIIRKHIAFMNK